MYEAYVGEIMSFGADWAPRDWAVCAGQVVSVSAYGQLFSVIGGKFGGDGVGTFALPDLRGRMPVHWSGSYPFAKAGGVETYALTGPESSGHPHPPRADGAEATTGSPRNAYWAVSSTAKQYSRAAGGVAATMTATTSLSGRGDPHENMMPFLPITYGIATTGLPPYGGSVENAYVSQLRLFAYEKPPDGWLPCDGQLLPISEHTELFALILTTYGGDGAESFGLPDLRARCAVNAGRSTTGSTYDLGQQGGEWKHALGPGEVGVHTHTVNASEKAGTETSPDGAVWGVGPSLLYGREATTWMKPTGAGSGSVPHENMQPYLPLTWAICVTGPFPPRGEVAV